MIIFSHARASWRLLFAFLVLSVSVHAFSFRNILGGRGGQRQDGLKGRIDRDSQTLLRPLDRGQSGFGSSEDGSAQVHEALSQLGSTMVANRPVRLDKKAGIVGATVYYAKEAFVLLFMNNGPKHDALNTDDGPIETLPKPLSSAVKLLEEVAANKQNPDAIYLLAELNFWGNYSHPRNYRQAFQRYHQLADLSGNATAQHMLGFFYSTGLAGVVGRNQARAKLYHTLAAEQGDIRSEMTLAFRAYAGIGERKDCDTSTTYYKRVADKSIAYSRSGPPGGQVLPRDSYHLADDVGGVYGEGASFSSSGRNAHRPRHHSDGDDNMLEYLDLMSRTGDPKATYSLGRLHYDGDRGVKRNYRLAATFFLKVTRRYWDENDVVIKKPDNGPGIAKLASKAAAYLGRLYLRGEGTKQNFKEAHRWFKLGLQTGEAFCQYELGLMHLLGLGVRKDPVLASNYLKEAALQDWPAAQARLGRLFVDQGDLGTAQRYFEFAARHGHIEAFYHLAEINNLDLEGRERNCGVAQSFYKVVAEKTENLHSDFSDANQLYEEGDTEGAILRYMMAAEQGYESAQANVAWLMDEQKSLLDLGPLLSWQRPGSPAPSKQSTSLSSSLRNAALALVYWTRSARQWNVDSAVKMGDAYFYGIGTPNADVEKAVACYQAAADSQDSAQAMWNLGWMHENGIGAEQDFHLAKRYYDMALEAAPEAYLPVKLALWKLRMRSRWNDWRGGSIKSMEYDDAAGEQKYKTWAEWLANFLEDEHPYYHQAGDGDGWPGDEEEYGYGFEEGTGGLLGDEYYLDDIDESVLDSLIIFALVGILSWLVWYRNQRQQAQQRQQQAQQGQPIHQQQANQNRPGQPNQQEGLQADGGFFPPPNDPNFNAWRAGGVGH